MGKQCLCVPTELFRQVGHFEGCVTGPRVKDYARVLLNPDNWSFQDRDTCEDDPSFKQIIPYTLISHFPEHGDDGSQYLRYWRTKAAGEQRLHGKASLGIGGHIEPQDMMLGDDLTGVPPLLIGKLQFLVARNREVFEEVMLGEICQRTPTEDHVECPIAAIINDDSNPVGQVHIGLVTVLEVKTPSVEAKDPELTDPRFEHFSELRPKYDEFEGWSKILLDGFWK